MQITTTKLYDIRRLYESLWTNQIHSHDPWHWFLLCSEITTPYAQGVIISVLLQCAGDMTSGKTTDCITIQPQVCGDTTISPTLCKPAMACSRVIMPHLNHASIGTTRTFFYSFSFELC